MTPACTGSRAVWEATLTRSYTSISALLALLLSMLVLAGCSGPSQSGADPRLEQAVSALKYMTTQRFLSRSAFSSIYPAGKPSEFVSYLFSDIGSAEWPIAFDEGEAEQLRSARIPAIPRDLPIIPYKPDPAVDMQVVVRADDAAGKVIIEAYAKAGEDPVLVEERVLPE